jgi:hypothetical protein
VLQLEEALQQHAAALEAANYEASQKASEIAELQYTVAAAHVAAEQRTQQLQSSAERQQQEADANVAALQGTLQKASTAADAAASATAADLEAVLCSLRFASGNMPSNPRAGCAATEGIQHDVPSSLAAAATSQEAAGSGAVAGNETAVGAPARSSTLQRAKQLAAAAAEAEAKFFTQQRLLQQAAAERGAAAQHTALLQVTLKSLPARTQASQLPAADSLQAVPWLARHPINLNTPALSLTQ